MPQLLSIPSSPVSESSTMPPSTPSGDTSPTLVDHDPDFLVPELKAVDDAEVEVEADGGEGEVEEFLPQTQKKKKKKKSKKSKAAKVAEGKKQGGKGEEDGRPQVLCISRNKHWRYISSYHGPWLQLPLELLESLLVLNLDPATLSDTPSTPLTPNVNTNTNIPRLPPTPTHSVPSTPRLPLSPHTHIHHGHNCNSMQDLPPPFPPPKPGKPTPPPIDPGVFRNVTQIRRLIDEAAELSVRASSGLSSSDLGSLVSPNNYNGGGNNSGGRTVAMSAMRIHRLRALAVQKLAQAYKHDEIASSVMVMQGGSVFDDIAERVLKVDPSDPDARYVHFFHEKIPSRQLAESTGTEVLDELIRSHPGRLEYFRTRGIVHCFRDEYSDAIRDFTHALKEARGARKRRGSAERERHVDVPSSGRKKGRKGGGGGKGNGQAPPDGTAVLNGDIGTGGEEDSPLPLHPSVLPDAPDPIEPQLLFLRGAAYLQHAIHLIESNLATFTYPPTTLLTDSRAYRDQLCGIREQVASLVKKSMRDHEKFLGHFDSLESPGAIPEGDVAFQIGYAFLLSESGRPGGHQHSAFPPSSPSGKFPQSNGYGSTNGSAGAGTRSTNSILNYASQVPATFTTYHPLLVESHYSILICLLLLADFRALLEAFKHTAAVVDGLEGYPVFLPPRSMAQAEFVEVLERLASGWAEGVKPHSLVGCTGGGGRGKARLAIEYPLPPTLPTPPSSAPSPIDEPCCSSSIPPPAPVRSDAAEALDCARILLAPVLKRQAEREQAEARGSNSFGGGGKKGAINIPLHGPRVEVILAWLGAVHLPEVEGSV